MLKKVIEMKMTLKCLHFEGCETALAVKLQIKSHANRILKQPVSNESTSPD